MPERNVDRMTRRYVADMLDLHPDSVTRSLPGLAAAVLVWGGRGKEMVLSRRGVMRYIDARDCRRDGGRRCRKCSYVLEDVMAVAEHLVKERHGYKECDECRPVGDVCQPCTAARGIA